MRRLYSIIVTTLLCATFISASAQKNADTSYVFRSDKVSYMKLNKIQSEGKEFWLTFMFQDLWYDNNDFPILEVLLSSRYDAKAHVSNPHTGWSLDVTVKADSLTKVIIPYQQGMCQQLYDKVEQTGILIEADTLVSVYASNFHANTFDATNILPSRLLGKEYVIQTYRGELDRGGFPKTEYGNCMVLTHEDMIATDLWKKFKEEQDLPQFLNMAYQFVFIDTIPFYNGDVLMDSVCMVERVPAAFAIVATENNTTVTITPSEDIYAGQGNTIIHHAHQAYTITLNQAETFQIIGNTLEPLSGTTISSDKNIAVFNGDICSLVPDTISACDHLVEQAMPLNMWGNQFVITCSHYQKYNQVIATAIENNTQIWIDDTLRTTLNALESYEFRVDTTQKARFVESDKPIACYLYLIGGQEAGGGIVEDTVCANIPPSPSFPYSLSDFATYEEYRDAYHAWYMSEYYPWSKKYGSCLDDHTKHIDFGDPSMVWITPLSQVIPKITFSPFYYDNEASDTPYSCHFINIVTPTATLTDMMLDGTNIASDFKPVRNHPEWSYAVKNINIGTHTIENNNDDGGFVAHIYGIGNYESYAYNVGALITRWDTTYIDSIAVIHWDIDTLCQTNSILRISYSADSMIHAVRIRAAKDTTINYYKSFLPPYSDNLIFNAHHLPTDTLFTSAYYNVPDSLGNFNEAVRQDTIIFGAKLPATILHQKWNDFIGVLTDDYNGGYSIVAYQWYKDGKPIEGENNAYMYRDLEVGAQYSALLTTADGTQSMTCPIVAIEKIDIMPFPTVVNTEALLKSPISHEDHSVYIYNTTGQLIYQNHLTEGNHTFHAPAQQGNYIIRFRTNDGIYRTYKMIVK